MSVKAGVMLLAVLGTGLVGLPRAHAFVCSRVPDKAGNQSGVATGWHTRTIPYAYNAKGTVELAKQDVVNTINASFQVWAQSTLRPGEDPTCTGKLVPGFPATSTDLQFSQLADTNQTFVGFNYLAPDVNMNMLIFRDDAWDHDLSVATTARSNIIALTTTTYNALTGEIYDADIEFDSVNFHFSTGDTNIQVDLMNTATHEIGHFLGFAHSTDPNATMYASASNGETIKRLLSCDDAAILWFRYPAGKPDLGACATDNISLTCGNCVPAGTLQFSPIATVTGTNDGRGGCACSASSANPAWLGLVLAACAASKLRRRGAQARAAA